jgi:hypothetical protein
MTLNSRITQLEQALANQPCSCPNNADLAWPGHQPQPNCPSCSGERILYTLNNPPGEAEPLIRAALPTILKTYDGTNHADLSKLTNHELQQLTHALQAAERPATNDSVHVAGERPVDDHPVAHRPRLDV